MVTSKAPDTCSPPLLDMTEPELDCMEATSPPAYGYKYDTLAVEAAYLTHSLSAPLSSSRVEPSAIGPPGAAVWFHPSQSNTK